MQSKSLEKPLLLWCVFFLCFLCGEKLHGLNIIAEKWKTLLEFFESFDDRNIVFTCFFDFARRIVSRYKKMSRLGNVVYNYPAVLRQNIC